MSKRLPNDPSESQLQRAVLDYLTLRGIFAWKATSTGIYDPIRRIFRKNPHAIGVADIIGCLPNGRILAIEVKKPGGKLSATQEAFKMAVIANKGAYCLARGVQDVVAALERFLGQ